MPSPFCASLISGRIFTLPVPAVAAHVRKCLFCFPTKNLLRLGRICINRCQITRAARSDNVRNRNIVDFGESVYHLQNTDAVASTEIEDLAARVRMGVLNRAQMTFGKSTTWI